MYGEVVSAAHQPLPAVASGWTCKQHAQQLPLSLFRRCRQRSLSVKSIRGQELSFRHHVLSYPGCRTRCSSGNGEDHNTSKGGAALTRDQLVVAAGGTALAIAALITANREDIADAVLGDGVTTGVSTWGVGDALGGVLWSITLYFCTPWQLLLIFLGRVDTERPSDWLIAKVGRAAGYNVEAIDYEAPLLLRALTVLFFSLCGTSVAWGFSAALGDATWSVSTGLGSLFAAGIYEVGRPDRLSVQEAQELEDQWQVFAQWADERLQPRGQCHESEIFNAFRQSFARYRSSEAMPDVTLRQMVRNWARSSERTSSGFYKKVSLRPRIDPFSGQSQGLDTSLEGSLSE